VLGNVLKDLPVAKDENLLVGHNTADDAGVYKLTDELALIQTVDFFTPIVDDPYTYGQIAAANALSDVYAMGGKPLTALNVVAFSSSIFPDSVLVDILKGGADKVLEAGAVTVGGHTITDDELKYGLAVSGIVHPDKIVKNSTAKPGDKLILTKPIGTGIVTTALKAGKNLGELYDRVCIAMMTLNKNACEAMQSAGVNACTDITGFGLMGHAMEMAKGSDAGIRIYGKTVPVFEEALNLVKEGFVPGGTRSNQAFLENDVLIDGSFSDEWITLLYDAQTSGGLLISVASEKLDMLMYELNKGKVETIAVIGEVTKQHPGKITIL
jgi:selenide, water dikinase